MMKKLRTFILLLLAACAVIPASAQWRIGIQAGYTRNSLSTSSGYFYDRRYVDLGGLTVGIPVQYGFTDWFAVGAEVDYIQKNYGQRRSGFYAPLHEDMTNHYLSVPIYGRFSFGGSHLRGFVDAGVYGGGWLSAHRKGTHFSMFGTPDDDSYNDVGSSYRLYSYDEKYEFDSRRDNRFEAGALIGVGLEYRFTPIWALQANFRYYRSLTDMQKDYMKERMPRYLDTFAFQLGVMVNL